MKHMRITQLELRNTFRRGPKTCCGAFLRRKRKKNGGIFLRRRLENVLGCSRRRRKTFEPPLVFCAAGDLFLRRFSVFLTVLRLLSVIFLRRYG